MVVEDQTEQIQFLSQSATYGPGGSRVDRIDTHSAVVFLVGDHAYKLKRAVRYDYLDFSTVEERRRACEAEVLVNRRTAPDLYLGVVPLTREADRRVALGGSGTPVDWLVHMRRFDDAGLMDQLAITKRLDVSVMAQLAAEIVRLHGLAEPQPAHGGRDGMAWVVEGNARGFAEEGSGALGRAECARAVDLSRLALDRASACLDRRQRAGLVRRCHGDLHLGNIVVIDGRPVLFDAVEFNDRISCIDVLYDLAFVLMDLWRLDYRRHANELFNAYLSGSRAYRGGSAAHRSDLEDGSSYQGLSLLPLFLSCRSAVRAKTSATASTLQADAVHATALAGAARKYLTAAVEFLSPPQPRLVAVSGRSGSGKSTQAQRVAWAIGSSPGAVILRSDAIRKTLFGVSETSRLGPEAYNAEVSARVYAALARGAAAVLAAGHSVIVDAVFESAHERRRIAQVAAAAGSGFTGVWLEAPSALLTERVDARRADASDATVDVVVGQLRRDPGPIEWAVVDASGTADQVERAVRARLGPLA